MNKVSIVKYQESMNSVEEAISLSGAFDSIKSGDTVFVKPNIVFWSRHTQMPPWGVITTTLVVEEVVKCLKDLSVKEIVIGEGIISTEPNDTKTPQHAFEALGYNELAKKYGVKIFDTFEREFCSVDMGDNIGLNFSKDLLDADFVVSVPVLKTHAQTKISLSQKNLKGCLDLKSRKKCHSDDTAYDLNYHIGGLSSVLPRSCTVIDGIYTLEKGPVYSGKARRSDLLLASSDLLAADIVGAATLGLDPAHVPHLVSACKRKGIAPTIKSVNVVGEPLEQVAVHHEWDFPYNEDKTLPSHLDKMGVKGICFPKYDDSLCSYCSGLVGVIQVAIAGAWKGTAFDKVEILTGKSRKAAPGMNHTLLFGKCQVELNKDNPHIKHKIIVPGCPPRVDKLAAGLKDVGIEVDPAIIDNIHMAPALFMGRYKDRPEFSLKFYGSL